MQRKLSMMMVISGTFRVFYYGNKTPLALPNEVRSCHKKKKKRSGPIHKAYTRQKWAQFESNGACVQDYNMSTSEIDIVSRSAHSPRSAISG
jgi:hypothetical protein